MLSTDTIVPELKATDRWQAIEELVDVLTRAKRLQAEHRGAALAALKKREQTMTTGIGFGVGIPHISDSPYAKEFVGVFARSAAGVDFAALDNKPVHLVVMFLSPQGQVRKHLQVLANISKFLHDKKLREQLLRAKDAAEILAIIKNHGAK